MGGLVGPPRVEALPRGVEGVGRGRRIVHGAGICAPRGAGSTRAGLVDSLTAGVEAFHDYTMDDLEKDNYGLKKMLE